MTAHFHELRQSLVDARAQFRTAKDAEKVALAEATQRANVAGRNAEERSVNLTIALQQDQEYLTALGRLRRWEYEVEKVEALLESACDDRRASEWQIRGKLADALLSAHVQTDHSDPTGEGAFDDVVDEQATRYASNFPATRSRLHQGQTEEDVAWQIHTGTYDASVAIEDEDLPF